MPVLPDITGFFPEARPYQIDGARAALAVLSSDTTTNTTNNAHNKAFLLADDPGLGKGLEALMVAEGLGAERVLIIGPAISRVSWPILIDKHAPRWAPDLMVPRFSERPAGWVHDDRLMLVLSYDMFARDEAARRWLPLLVARRWDLLVLDECHALKDSEAVRTRNIYGAMDGRHGSDGLHAAADRVLLLSGTPCPNHAAELFPHYATFWPHLLRRPDGAVLGRTDFEERYTRYVDGPWGRQIQGSRGQDRLRSAFGGVILRRQRHEVLTELPPLTVQDVPLLKNSGDRWSRIPPKLRDVHEALMATPQDAVVDTLSSAGAAETASLAALRRLLGAAKAGPAADWARERLGLGVEKLLLFCWHREVIREIERALWDFRPMVVSGATSDQDRVQAVKTFQQRDDSRIFVGQLRAAGTAITLTRASEVAIVEPSWTPSDNEQAIARAWRLGQRNPVLASFLFLPGSLDQYIMTAFRRKAGELTRLWRGSSDTQPASELL